MSDNHRLVQQISFIKQAEELKTVQRQNQTLDGRFENSAEHSWQLALMAMTLKEHYPKPINLEKVMIMLLLHDLGEIGAGDTSAFDEKGKQFSYQRELDYVHSLFSTLPYDQADLNLTLWQEFEKGTSNEARYARCIDAIAPLLNHSFIARRDENPDDLTVSQVLSKKAFIKEESLSLWKVTLSLIEESVARGLYRDDR